MLKRLICWIRRSHDYGRPKVVARATDGAGTELANAKRKSCRRCGHTVAVKPRRSKASV